MQFCIGYSDLDIWGYPWSPWRYNHRVETDGIEGLREDDGGNMLCMAHH